MALLPRLTHRLGHSLFLPAHGRGAALPDGLRQLLRQRAGIWDLPELPSLGGPLEPEGAIAESQRNAAAQMGVAPFTPYQQRATPICAAAERWLSAMAPSASSGPPRAGSSGRSQMPARWRSKWRSPSGRAAPRPWAGRNRD